MPIKFNARQMMEFDRRGMIADMKKLSTNFIDIISDCKSLEDFEKRNPIQDSYPLVAWLLSTPYAQRMRAISTNPQKLHKSTEEGIEWEMDTPGSVWTLEPSNSGTDCCWTMPDFAKCDSSVPLFLLCLKDCDNIFDTLIMDRLRINERSDLLGIARSGETVNEVNDRIRKLWFAFYIAHTAVLGTSTTSDNITKPFHGLLEVVEDSAVMKFSGANVLAGFASMGCRLAALDGRDSGIIAVNPLIKMAIEEAVQPDDKGRYPAKWSRVNGELRFMGLRFLEDKLVPVNVTEGIGEAWVLFGDSVGLFLAYNLYDAYVIRDDFTEKSKEEGCGELCTYLCNYGTVGSSDANRIMVMQDIAISSACTDIADLVSLINPSTLIPAA